MANEFGIGLSPITDKIYIGKQNKAKRMWVGRKTDFTDNFLDVMFQYLALDECREIVTGNDKAETTTHFFIHFTGNKKSLQKAMDFVKDELKNVEVKNVKPKKDVKCGVGKK